MSELGQPVKSFADTFSAETVIMNTFFPEEFKEEIWFDDAGWFIQHEDGTEEGPFDSEEEVLELMVFG